MDRATKIKTTKLILGASSNFSRKFPPTKITRYTVGLVRRKNKCTALLPEVFTASAQVYVAANRAI